MHPVLLLEHNVHPAPSLHLPHSLPAQSLWLEVTTYTTVEAFPGIMRWFEVATTLVVSHCKWNHEQTMHCCRLVSHSTHQPFCRMWLVACSLSVSFISVTEATTCLQLSLLLFCANVSCAKCRVCLFAFGAGGIEPAGKCHCVCEGWYCSPEEPDQAAQK